MMIDFVSNDDEDWTRNELAEDTTDLLFLEEGKPLS